jgi:hypothetical protein
MNKPNTGKPKPRQLEVAWFEPESFTLITQHAVDGDRVIRESAQRAADQQESAKLQTQFPKNLFKP